MGILWQGVGRSMAAGRGKSVAAGRWRGAIAVFLLAGLAGCQTVAETAKLYPAGERIVYTTYNPDGYDQVLRGAYKVKAAQIHGDLFLPEGTGKVPVVVLVHGSGRPENRYPFYRQLVPALHAAGIGAFVVDAFTGRGIADTVADQGQVSIAGTSLDAWLALKAISAHPRVDAARVGISGYSRGAIGALHTLSAPLTKAAVGGLAFAAHLPVYPSCQTRFEKPDFTGAPTLILAGGADDYTPAKFCIDMVGDLKVKGVPIDIKVYDGANHAFDNDGSPSVCASCVTFADCGLATLHADGVETALDGRVSTKQGWVPFTTAIYKQCGRMGATIGGQEKARVDSVKTAVSFFSGALGKRTAAR